jgi:hypothetical protein
LSLYRAFAVGTRTTWSIEHAGAGGAELLFVLDKALGYATFVRNSVLAKPHRIRRARICILLSVRECRQGCRDHDNNESNGAQFTHDVHSNLGLGVATIEAVVCSDNPAAPARAVECPLRAKSRTLVSYRAVRFGANGGLPRAGGQHVAYHAALLTSETKPQPYFFS